jgi:hypothetical protein
MAKAPKRTSAEIETPVIQMRHVGPQRFDVVVGFVRGVFVETKRLETNVSMVVATGTATKALNEQHEKAKATVNPLAARPS